MNKKQAQQEILRRLEIYLSETYVKNYSAIAELVLYDLGELSKQELIKMIVVDENGNLLSEPKYGMMGYDHKYQEYQQAFNQATEIVNCYESTDVI